MLKSHWKRWIVLASLAIVVALVGACQSDEGPKPTLKLVNTEYETAWLMNAVAKFILGNGYGYDVEDVSLAVPVAQTSLSNGDVHVWLDTWYWYYDSWWSRH